MSSGEDWLLRPVGQQWCKYESLKDRTLDLHDVAVMNEALDIQFENQRRVTEWLRTQPNG